MQQEALRSGGRKRLCVRSARKRGPRCFLVWQVADVGMQIEWKSGFIRFVLIDVVNPDQMPRTESVYRRESLQTWEANLNYKFTDKCTM
jgi:hypothetical protein